MDKKSDAIQYLKDCDFEHHKRYDYCHTRLKYRQSKLPTAVKVYTVGNESKHLLVFGVPKVNLYNETKNLFKKYGHLERTIILTQELVELSTDIKIELEQFTDVYHITFKKLEHARRAKKFLDARNFYGGILHISYAPELETNTELKQKIAQRIREVKFKIHSQISKSERKKLKSS